MNKEKNNLLQIKVITNFNNIRLRLLLAPLFFLFLITIFLLNKNYFSINGYIKIQENLFFYLNSKLSESPNLQFNVTQLGDTLILLSLLGVFIIYVPKLWEALLTSSLISLVLSFLLKKLFSVPRPAGVFDTDHFVIIGKTLSESTSLPSGHSMTTFIVITTVLFAFTPQKITSKIAWCFSMLLIGLIISFSRVGVGAHYPLDVVIGSIIGFITALIGIVISNKVNWFKWIQNKKYYPIFILLLIIFGYAIVNKIVTNNLLIFYFSLFSIFVTLYLMISNHVKN